MLLGLVRNRKKEQFVKINGYSNEFWGWVSNNFKTISSQKNFLSFLNSLEFFQPTIMVNVSLIFYLMLSLINPPIYLWIFHFEKTY